MIAPTFLSDDDVATLTGRKVRKLQVEQLRKMGIPFYLNAVGRPVVARSIVEGRVQVAAAPAPRWQPSVLHRAQ